MFKAEKGITLVALVITIIVLIILAGVSISAAFNGGIIDNAKNAKTEYNATATNDTVWLNDMTNTANTLYHENK